MRAIRKSLYYNEVDFNERWNDLEPLIDGNINHVALDVGCAEGEITINLAKKFKFVHAFDNAYQRIIQARRKSRGIRNIDFSAECMMAYGYGKYDQIFCLGVLHKIKIKPSREHIFSRMLHRCKSVLYLRVPIVCEYVPKTVGLRDVEVLKIAETNNFVLEHRTTQRPNHGTLFKFKRR